MAEFQAVKEVEAEAKAEPVATTPLLPPTMAEYLAGEEKLALQSSPPPEPNVTEAIKVPSVEQILAEPRREKISPERSSPDKISGGSIDRDLALTRVKMEKKTSLIKAWEESQKAKLENKAQRKMSFIATWENSKRASIEAEIKKMEEAFEKKKAERTEKMKNRIASVHKEAEEKRAMVEAKMGEDMLMSQESAAKFRAEGKVPRKVLGCFGSF